ncbi:MAG: hypothetical protein M1836_006949 [Candelina mexicana]|nr:MAG: hypothetical protein M1836_006949 [Candelina mexicana]
MASSASVTPEEQSLGWSTYAIVKEQSDDTNPSHEEDPAEVLSTSSTTSLRSRLSSTYWSAKSSAFWSARSLNSVDRVAERRNFIESPFRKIIRERVLQNTNEGSEELDWSGMGQHIELEIGQPIPGVTNPMILAHTANSLIEVVTCRRITVVRKSVALKRAHLQNLEGSDHFLSALQEVRSLSRLRHAHIVQLVGTYLQGNRFNMLLYPEAQYDLADFMECCINERLSSGQPDQYNCSLAKSLHCVLEALHYIHSKHIEHLDIKPKNILFKRDKYPVSLGRKEFRQPKYSSQSPKRINTLKRFPDSHVLSAKSAPFKAYLCDFGISRDFASELESQTDDVAARTLRYCSPEVFNYGRYGRSADIFSLGCVFIEIWSLLHNQGLEELNHQCFSSQEDRSFQGNLASVTLWVNTLKANPGWAPGWFQSLMTESIDYNIIVGFGIFSYDNSRSDEVPRFSHVIEIEHISQMLNTNPSLRPSTEELLRHLWKCECCLGGAEPFRIEA